MTLKLRYRNECVLAIIKVNQYYLGQRTFRSKIIIHTHTHTHTLNQVLYLDHESATGKKCRLQQQPFIIQVTSTSRRRINQASFHFVLCLFVCIALPVEVNKVVQKVSYAQNQATYMHRTPPVEAHRSVVTYLQFPIQCAFRATTTPSQPQIRRPYMASTSVVTDNLVKLIVD